jgi:head-tail adaptor
MSATNPGLLRHRVTLDNPSTPTSDGDGGAAVLWPPAGGVQLGARVPAAVDSTSIAREQPIAKTHEGVGTFTVRLRYLPGVSLSTRVTWHDGAIDRVLWVNEIADDEQRHALIALTCAERAAG